MKIKGNIIDILNREIFFGEIEVEGERIKTISRLEGQSNLYILPGFTDAHIHIESSMLIPSEFARMAVVHGTVATVSDPHEIANVLGIQGVNFMIENGRKVPLKFNFGAPSCVPATHFETAGSEINVEGIRELLENADIKYLAEMMNYPGVIFEDEMVLSKLKIAKELGKPIDGHAPGLRGENIRKYIAAGITTDHECFSYEEALEKLELGMKIIIREGSAAKNFEALIDLLPKYPNRIMFCSDDKHPDDLIEGHINQLVARALRRGCNLFDVLKVACINPVEHYDLDVGLLKEGDFADFIVTDDLVNFNIQDTYINGELVAKEGVSKIQSIPSEIPNNFKISSKRKEDFAIKAEGEKVQVIKAINGEIVTDSFVETLDVKDGFVESNIEKDIIKITVVNRYQNEPPALGFINGFDLKNGAIASCVGHDSHNIIAVGTDDDLLCKAVNLIIENKGGISAVSEVESMVLPLPIAGIMTNEDGYKVAKKYSEIDAFVKEKLGSKLTAPFMTLSFMALLVIPSLKLGDKGLFDGNKFEFTDLFIK